MEDAITLWQKETAAESFFACHSLLQDMVFVNTKKGVSKPSEKDTVFSQGTRTRTVNQQNIINNSNDQKFHSEPLALALLNNDCLLTLKQNTFSVPLLEFYISQKTTWKGSMVGATPIYWFIMASPSAGEVATTKSRRSKAEEDTRSKAVRAGGMWG